MTTDTEALIQKLEAEKLEAEKCQNPELNLGLDMAIAIIRSHTAASDVAVLDMATGKVSFPARTFPMGDAPVLGAKARCAEVVQPTSPAIDSIGSPTRYTDGSYSREYEEQPSAEVVERVAAAIMKEYRDTDCNEWAYASKAWKEYCVDVAKAAIAAMGTGHIQKHSTLNVSPASGNASEVSVVEADALDVLYKKVNEWISYGLMRKVVHEWEKLRPSKPLEKRGNE